MAIFVTQLPGGQQPQEPRKSRWAIILSFLERHQPLIDIGLWVVELGVLVVLVWTLRAAQQTNREMEQTNKTALEANKSARQALENSFIPWVKVQDFNQRTDRGFKVIDMRVKNFSSSPALNISISIKIGTITLGPSPAGVQMPNDEDIYSLAMPGDNSLLTFEAQEFFNGKETAVLDVHYSDRFYNTYWIQQDFMCRTTNAVVATGFKIIDFQVPPNK